MRDERLALPGWQREKETGREAGKNAGKNGGGNDPEERVQAGAMLARQHQSVRWMAAFPTKAGSREVLADTRAAKMDVASFPADEAALRYRPISTRPWPRPPPVKARSLSASSRTSRSRLNAT